jgi:TPR repeat protein
MKFKLLIIFSFLFCCSVFANINSSKNNASLEKEYEKLEFEALNGKVNSQYQLFLLVTRNQPYLNSKVSNAFKQIIKAGQSGHTEAQFTIGSLYQTGYIVEQDRKVAFGWLKEAANKGHTDAQVLLANNLAYQRLESKLKTEQDKLFDKAGYWYQQAIDSGSVKAKRLYGIMLIHNNTDSELGLELIIQASEQGDASSMHSLGVHYKYQWRKSRELKFLELSQKWYKKSFNAGFVEARESYSSLQKECEKHHQNNAICNF